MKTIFRLLLATIIFASIIAASIVVGFIFGYLVSLSGIKILSNPSSFDDIVMNGFLSIAALMLIFIIFIIIYNISEVLKPNK